MELMDGCSVRETHVSILLFLEAHVLKLRKPLRFDFADFSTLGARAEDCRREVDLNRRLAPDVYLGVADITMGGETLDHLVVMRRLPAERSLAHLVSSEPETVWGVELHAVARVLADFHARADRSPEISATASITAVSDHFEANVAATARFVGPILDPSTHDAVVGTIRRYLAGRDPLFTARIAAGQICDGHGDLQADDIYCLDDGPRILDCLEFDERLRWGDVVADVAFLAMDLERLGKTEAAARFVSDYEERVGAQLPPSLLHTYIALRAYVRIKVACIRHEQGNPDAAEEAVRAPGTRPDPPGAGSGPSCARRGPPRIGQVHVGQRAGRRPRCHRAPVRRAPRWAVECRRRSFCGGDVPSGALHTSPDTRRL